MPYLSNDNNKSKHNNNNNHELDEKTFLLQGGEEEEVVVVEEKEDNNDNINIYTVKSPKQTGYVCLRLRLLVVVVTFTCILASIVLIVRWCNPYYKESSKKDTMNNNNDSNNNTMGEGDPKKKHQKNNDNNLQQQSHTTAYSSGRVTQKEQQSHYKFPDNFVWGTATSSFQIEGGIKERGYNIWDIFCESQDKILDHSNANVACDHYHHVLNDVQLLSLLNIKAYRFSISWSRILPHGTLLGGINQAGLDFYNFLIDTLLEYNIEPWITLFHWDLPFDLYKENNNTTSSGGGWLNQDTITAFAEDYARLCFTTFGNRVKHWITFNEAWTVAVNGHGTGVHAPGHYSDTEPYIVGHNILLAHVRTVQIYKTEFYQQQQQQNGTGMIGISNCGDFRYPKTSSKTDVDAAERAMIFQFGWFVDPLLLGFGDYPDVMRERIGNERLPTFTKEQREMLLTWGPQTDFIGLNYYSSLLATVPTKPENYQGYWVDVHANFSRLDRRSNHDNHDDDDDDDDDIDWTVNDMNWPIVPDGLREMLLWIAKRYNNPLVFITENGSAEKDIIVDLLNEKPLVDDHDNDNDQQQQYYIHDEKRRAYFEAHLRASATALSTPVVMADDTMQQENTGGTPTTPPLTTALRLGGYFAWSLMDNFEWQFGYQRRFGLCHVDFESLSLQRTPKRSAYWYKTTIQNHGRNIPYKQPKSWFPVAMAFNPTPANARQQRQRQQQKSRFTNDDEMIENDDVKNGEFQSETRQQQQRRMPPPRKRLPERLLIGYGSDVEKVRAAVFAGVNVVIWSFVEIKAVPDEINNCDDKDHVNIETRTRTATAEQSTTLPERRQQQEHQCRKKTSISTNLDLPSIQKLMAELDQEGYHHVVHLVSFGGWNGLHLDLKLNSSEWWNDGFMEHLGHIFDGLDWDLEGHDDLKSPTNCFTLQTLQCMGEISRLAKNDNYWIGLAPPQSYLDMVTDDADDDNLTSGQRFSRYVNLTDPLRPWHSHFSYYGANVYAYLLAKYGDYMDFISIQFYESFSRAADATFRNGQTPVAYLKHYLNVLSQQHDSFYVNFSSDPDMILDNDDDNNNSGKREDTAVMSSTLISLPRSKLVLGLANGWALNPDLKDTGKVFFLRPDEELRQLWKSLEEEDKNRLPRGFMFWTINEEGQNQVSLASSLADIIFTDLRNVHEYCYNDKIDCDKEDGSDGDAR